MLKTTDVQKPAPFGPLERMRFDEAPMMLYWESTQACDLACVHCRADAIPERDPRELSTEEAKALFDEAARFGDRPPHLVITGGDPLHRPDLFELIAYGKSVGLAIYVTPAGTGRLTPGVIQKIKEAGAAGMALSLDGSGPEAHDAFRGVAGSFAWTFAAARAANEAGVPLQINTMVTARTLADLPRIAEVVAGLRVYRWALFFLIQTGRGRSLAQITPGECEALMHALWERMEASRSRPPIRTTEAPHFKRVAIERMRARGMDEAAILRTPLSHSFGIRDGNGVAFVSHTGEVFPSGFLPVAVGDVRRESLVEVYRGSETLRALRDPERLKGRCGACPYRAACGGSRARAYAATGDFLESDPLCSYEPAAA